MGRDVWSSSVSDVVSYETAVNAAGVATVAVELGVSRATVYRVLAESIIAAWCVPLGATLDVTGCYRRAASRCGVAVLATDCGWAGRVDETGLTAATGEAGAVSFAARPRNGFVRGFQIFMSFSLTTIMVPRRLLGVSDA